MLAGGIYPLAFSPFDFWPAAFISLSVLLSSFFIKVKMSPFKIGFYWGVGCFGVGASWVYVSIHEFGFVPAPGAAALTLLFVSILSVYKGIFTVTVSRMIRYTDLKFIAFIAPLAWLLSEYLQATIFNGFPWLLTGYSQIDSPIGPLATWLGVYGVGWITVAISALFVAILFNNSLKEHLFGLAVVLGCLVIANIQFRNTAIEGTEPKSLDIALVQPNILQHEKWNRQYFGKIINILYEETSELWGADLIVWPEGAIPAYAHQVNDITFDLTQKAKDANSQIILGIPEYNSQQKRSYVALNAYGEIQQSYYKQVLVPFGEYVPLESWLRGLIQFLDLPMSGFTEANNQVPMNLGDYQVIPAICYEIAYPEIIRQLAEQVKDKPMLIVTVSNEAWFGDSFGPYQHMQMARMRALELGLPLVRATNDGITGVINERGEVEALLPRYKQAYLRQNLTLNNRKTIYRNWGLTGLMGLVAVSIGILVIFRLRHAS